MSGGGRCWRRSGAAQAQAATTAGYDFIEAVKKSDGGKATQLLSDHPTASSTADGKGNTALIIAINRSDENWTGFLLNKGADPNLAGKGRRHAADRGRPDRLRGRGRHGCSSLGAKVDGTNKHGRDAADRRGPAAPAADRSSCCSSTAPIPTRPMPPRAIRRATMPSATTAAREILQLIEDKKPKPRGSSR